MATKASELLPIQITAGVEPSTDRTNASTIHYTAADKIRFRDNFPEKLGGWLSSSYEYGNSVSGVVRSIFSALIGNNIVTMLGSHLRLYSLVGQRLTNVTPLQTTTHAIANSLETDYLGLTNNPFTTVLGSKIVTVTDPNCNKFLQADRVTLSGAAATGGVPDTDLNKQHIIRTINPGVSYTIQVATAATSSASGGGASVVSASGLLRVTATAHGQATGDRTKITLAGDSGGILAASINLEFVVRIVSADAFDIMTGGTATSHVSAAGGANTLYQKQIAAGSRDESFGQGYGMGLYGVGLYGVAALSSSGRRYPRIWFFDRFADRIVMTAGNQTGLYVWDGSTVAAAALIAGAPAAVNYAFVSDNILVTFGASNINNRIKTSDQGDVTQWTGSSTNQVFADDIEGAGRFMSHVPVGGDNLIFTESQTYLMHYRGLPLIWDIELLDGSIGIIAPMARCTVKGVAYWMGRNNFYRWAGGNIEIVPSNTKRLSTLLNYVFKGITGAQRSKSFLWYNQRYDELWFHYCSPGSLDPDRIARFNVGDGHWVPDTMNRTAAEYPHQLLNNPRLMDANGTLFNHEVGNDDGASPMAWSLTTNLMTSGKATALISGLLPDSGQAGNISVRAEGFRFPQSTAKMYDDTYTVAADTEQIATKSANARFWKFTLSGNVLGQSWMAGRWGQFSQKGAEQ